MLAYLLRRLFFAVVVVATVATLTYGLYRGLRPELYPGDSFLGGVASDLGRVFLHLDFGESCGNPGCPSIQEMWARSWTADLYLLVGGIVLGVLGGLAAAAWCAARPRTLSARVVEGLGSVVYSMPVYVVAFGLLLLFEPTFGVLPLPLFFHPIDYETPLANPWDSCARWPCPGSSWRRRWGPSACASRWCRSTRSPTPITSAPPSRRASHGDG